MKYDIEKVLRGVIPDLFKLMEGQKIRWSSINTQLYNKSEERKRKFHENNGYLKDENNFYDVIIQSLQGDKNHLVYFVYLNYIFQSLSEELTIKEKEMVGKTVRKILTNLKLNYIHFFGELFVLRYLLDFKKYRLTGVEDKQKNGQEIDFKIQGIDDNIEVLVEVLNLHLNDSWLKDKSSIERHLNNKFKDKVEEKTKGDLSNLNFTIIPVLWGNTEQLLKVVEVYESGFVPSISIVNEPFSYICWSDDEMTNTDYLFSPITKIFNRGKPMLTKEFSKVE